MKKIKDLNLSPTDRVALHQSRELNRRRAAIRRAGLPLMATVFAKSLKRYMQLVDDARKVIRKEASRIYELDHPKRQKEK